MNLASRLESAAPVDSILIGDDTYRLIQADVACRAAGQINAKGFATPVTAWEIVDFRDEMDRQSQEIEKLANVVRNLEEEAAARPWRGDAARILAEAAGRLDMSK